MKVNFAQQLKSFDGGDFEEATGRKNADGSPEMKKITLAIVAANAALGTIPDKTDTGEEKARAYAIAQKVYVGGVVELTAEEVSFLKDRIGRLMPTLVVGQAYAMLEGGVADGHATPLRRAAEK